MLVPLPEEVVASVKENSQAACFGRASRYTPQHGSALAVVRFFCREIGRYGMPEEGFRTDSCVRRSAS